MPETAVRSSVSGPGTPKIAATRPRRTSVGGEHSRVSLSRFGKPNQQATSYFSAPKSGTFTPAAQRKEAFLTCSHPQVRSPPCPVSSPWVGVEWCLKLPPLQHLQAGDSKDGGHRPWGAKCWGNHSGVCRSLSRRLNQQAASCYFSITVLRSHICLAEGPARFAPPVPTKLPVVSRGRARFSTFPSCAPVPLSRGN